MQEDKVVGHFSSGQDDAFVNARYFTFCEPSGEQAVVVTSVVSLRRKESVIAITFMPGGTESDGDYWYVSDAERSQHLL